MALSAQNTDKDLFHRIACGDEMAFEELFRRWDRRIYPFVLKMVRATTLAEEITQEIFIKIWQHRERLEEVDNPEAYIFTITVRHTLDQIRRQLNENRMLQKLSVVRRDAHNDTDETLLLRDRAALVQQAVDQLSPQQKAVYLLSRHEGLNYEQIGRRLDISPNTVRNHLVKALQSIRTYMDEQDFLPTLLLTYAWIMIKK